MNLLACGRLHSWLHPSPLQPALAMRKLSNQPQQIAEDQQQSLTNAHLFTQYMLQEQMRDQVFMASLTTFRTELRRIQKSALLRHAPLDWYLAALRELKQQFESYVTALRRRKLIQFTLPMELALFATRTQWFMHYQGPQIRQGWQQAAQGFQQMSDSDYDK